MTAPAPELLGLLDPRTLATFCVATLALVATPGPAVGVIVTATLRRGRSSGLAAVAGIAVGDAVQVAAAVCGLAALLAASATAFTVVKVAGALWLVWLAVRALRARTPGTVAELTAAQATPVGARERRATTRTAALVGILNPKPALFHLAFLPQFVDPARGPVWAQMAVLGVVFTAVAVLGNTGWMLGGTALRRFLPRLRLVVVERFSAGVYAAFAALALAARRLA